MSWILGIDTSSAELSVGLINEGAPVASYSRWIRNSHAEHIAKAITFLLESNDIRAQDIAAAGVACGPGSFTGLRIGISFIKGLFTGRDTRILPISSLASVAAAMDSTPRTIAVGFDARQGRVFGARFRREGEYTERLSEDRLMPIDEFAGSLTEKDLVIADTMGYAKSVVFESLHDRPSFLNVRNISLNRGLSCARAASRNIHSDSGWVSTTDLLPRYLQLSYAETMAKSQGKE